VADEAAVLFSGAYLLSSTTLKGEMQKSGLN
jgi:hypothetical protein